MMTMQENTFKGKLTVIFFMAVALLFTALFLLPIQAYADNEIELIESLTIDGLPVCHTVGQKIATVDGETVTELNNVTWDDEQLTLNMNGADIGPFSYCPDEELEGTTTVTIALAPGSDNSISGKDELLFGRGIVCRANLNIVGSGELTVSGGLDIDKPGNEITLEARFLTIDDNAVVTIQADCFCAWSAELGFGLKVVDGILNTNGEVHTDGAVIVEPEGVLNVIIAEVNKSSKCLSTNSYGSFPDNIIRGTVRLENPYSVYYETIDQTLHGVGISLANLYDQKLVIDGGQVMIKTAGQGIETFGHDVEVLSGAVDITSEYDTGISGEKAPEKQEPGFAGTLTISGGDLEVLSHTSNAVVMSNFKMTGGRLHATATCKNEPEADPYSVIFYGESELGEGMSITLPEGGSLNRYLGDSYTVLDQNGKPVKETIIEATQPTPGSAPIPTPDPNHSPDTGIQTASSLWQPLLLVIGALILGIVLYKRHKPSKF